MTMDHNPYAPPAAPVTDVIRGGRLYSPRQIFAASFIGSPIAAAWFIYRNFLTLGRDALALRTLWIGVGATIAVFVVAFSLPKQVPHMVLPIAYSYAIYQYTQHLFKTEYHDHLVAGGRTGSWWSVIGVSVLSVLILFGVIFALIFAAPSLFKGL